MTGTKLRYTLKLTLRDGTYIERSMVSHQAVADDVVIFYLQNGPSLSVPLSSAGFWELV